MLTFSTMSFTVFTPLVIPDINTVNMASLKSCASMTTMFFRGVQHFLMSPLFCQASCTINVHSAGTTHHEEVLVEARSPDGRQLPHQGGCLPDQTIIVWRFPCKVQHALFNTSTCEKHSSC